MKTRILLIGFLLLNAVYVIAQHQSVKMFGSNPQHTGGYKNAEANAFQGVKWKFKTNARIHSSPVISNGIAYIGSGDNNLYAVDIKSGNEIWHFTTGGAVHSTPAVYKNTVYFLSFDGHFYALDARTGQKKWSFQTGGEQWVGGYKLWHYETPELYKEDLWQYFLSSPVVEESENPTVFFGSSDTHLYALDGNSGSLKWKFKTDGKIHTSPALHNGAVFIGSWDKKVYAVDVKTGQEKWQFRTKDDPWNWGGMEGILASPVVAEGKVLIGSRDGFFYALDESTGALQWEYSANWTWVMGSAAVSDGMVYFGTSDTNKFIGLDLQTGVEKMSFTASGYLYSSPAIAGNTAYIGSYSGKVYAVDLQTGKDWSEFQTDGSKTHMSYFYTPYGTPDYAKTIEGTSLNYYEADKYFLAQLDKCGPFVSTPTILNKTIYIGSIDGNLYAINLGKNKSPELKVFSPEPDSEHLTGSDIIINCAAEDKDGISMIEYFASYYDGHGFLHHEKLGESINSPFTWPSVPANNYTLTIRVLGKKGGRTTEYFYLAVKDTLSNQTASGTESIADAYAFPNPFENHSRIRFKLAKPAFTKVSIYSETGEVVAVLLEDFLKEGEHFTHISHLSIKQGKYYCKIESGGSTKIIQLIRN